MIVVKNTSPTAASVIGAMTDLNSCQSVFHAEENSSGGRKSIKTISGFSIIIGKPGIILINIPLNTKTMGNGNLYLLLNIPKNEMTNNIQTIMLTFSI